MSDVGCTSRHLHTPSGIWAKKSKLAVPALRTAPTRVTIRDPPQQAQGTPARPEAATPGRPCPPHRVAQQGVRVGGLAQLAQLAIPVQQRRLLAALAHLHGGPGCPAPGSRRADHSHGPPAAGTGAAPRPRPPPEPGVPGREGRPRQLRAAPPPGPAPAAHMANGG